LALQSQKRYGDTEPIFMRIADAARNKLLLWGMREDQMNKLESSGKSANTLTFYSKYSGVATEVNVAEGDYVSEGSLIFRLADVRALWAEAQLYVSDLPFLSQTEETLVEIPSFPDRKLRGKVSFVNPALESSSKIVLIRVEIPNPGGDYQPGMQAWMTLKGKVKQAVAVPTNALIRGKEGTTVWLRKPSGAFESRMVTTGIANRQDAVKGERGLPPGLGK